MYKSLTDCIRQAPGLCRACTKKLSDSHSFIKIKHNLQWSWQQSSQVTNQPVMVGQTKWILPCSLSKAGWKTRLDEWQSSVCVVQGCTNVHEGSWPTVPSKRDELSEDNTPRCLQLCSWTPCAPGWAQWENNCCMLDLCQLHSPKERSGYTNTWNGTQKQTRVNILYFILFLSS